MLGITELTYTSLISFLIVVILGPIFIPMLTKFKFGQTVRDDGPKTHLAKNGTPTMGGILMIVAILITGLTRSKVGPDMVIGLICIFGFGLIGFIDDFIIIKKRRSLGLKPWQKIVMQFGLALYVANYQYCICKCTSAYGTIYRYSNKFRAIICSYNDICNSWNS